MNVLEYIIRAKDQTHAGLSAAKASVASMGKDVASGIMGTLGKVAAGFGLITGAAAIMQKAFSEAFEVQRLTAQMKTLLGSVDAAAQRMKELSEWKVGAGKGLFDDADIAKASMNLEKLTGGAISGAAALNLLGDTAAATGNSMESISFAVGKAFGQLAEGMPIDRAMMQLQALGVLGPDVIKTMKDMERQGASGAEMWNVVEAALARYKGGMADLAGTGAGAMTALKTAANEVLETLGLWLSKGILPVINAIKQAADLLGRVAGGEGLAQAVNNALKPERDPLIRTQKEVEEEAAANAKKQAAFDNAKQKQQEGMDKIQNLRDLEFEAKAGRELTDRASARLQDLQAPGGFDRFIAANPQARINAQDLENQRRGPAYQAALARIGVENRAGVKGETVLDAQGRRERTAMDALKARNEINKAFDLKDAQGFSDKTASKLANKVLEGRKLTAAESAVLSPEAMEAAQDRREQRLAARVAKGGQLNRQDADFMKQREAFKEAKADAEKVRAAEDKKRQDAQGKLDEVNKLKQKALDKIAANTDDLPDLLKAK